MEITGLDLLFLEVNNLEESLVFYRDILGFIVESHNPDAEPPIARVRAGNFKITLVQQLETMLRRGRGVSFFLGVDNVEDLYMRLHPQIAGLQEPIDEGWGGRFITVEDPDKYRFFFVTWAVDKRSPD